MYRGNIPLVVYIRPPVQLDLQRWEKCITLAGSVTIFAVQSPHTLVVQFNCCSWRVEIYVWITCFISGMLTPYQCDNTRPFHSWRWWNVRYCIMVWRYVVLYQQGSSSPISKFAQLIVFACWCCRRCQRERLLLLHSAEQDWMEQVHHGHNNRRLHYSWGSVSYIHCWLVSGGPACLSARCLPSKTHGNTV